MRGQPVLGGPVPRQLKRAIYDIGEPTRPLVSGEDIETEAQLYYTVIKYFSKYFLSNNQSFSGDRKTNDLRSRSLSGFFSRSKT